MKKRLALGALGALVTFGAADAFAIVGRPLTPVSVAGVARRTTRRTVVAGAAVAGTAAVAAAALTALPAGCAVGVPCAGVVYRPVYQGTTLVYVPEDDNPEH